jgi:hypothetical protein
MQERNPLIEPENYFEGYKKSIEALKHHPEIIEFDKLCYELFENQPAGKTWIKLVTEKYLLPTLVSRGNPTYQIDLLWQEGFKDFIRMVFNCVTSHKQRINSQGS